MKKILLSLSISLSAAIASAQVIFSVEAPASIQGAYDMTWGTAAQGWSGPDLLNPANAVIDTLALALDGTTADSLVCNPVVNGGDVAGKVAILYRGECQFGTKALNAQNAGAIAVVIINNAPGSPVGMAAGDDGGNVTIPVVMISEAAGQILVDEMQNGFVEVFIGNKTGFYPNDLGLLNRSILRAKSSATPSLLAQDQSEFDFQVGAWIYNYGFNNQTGITLSATCEFDGNTVYTETSTPIALIESGDSAYVTLPAFSLANYDEGYYDFFYTIESDSVDNYAFDNTIAAHFKISATDFSYASYDRDLNVPRSSGGFRSSTANNSYSACVVFRDPNASRVAATGLTFAAVTGAASGTDLEGEELQISAFRWDDVFTDLNDAPAQMTSYTEIGVGEYFYPENLQGEMVTGNFSAPVLLVDNQRYVFCVTTFNEDVFIGYDPNMDYTLNIANYQQPLFPVESDGSYPILGFGEDAVPGIAIKFMDAQFVSVPQEELEIAINAYPNPASTQVTLSFNNNEVNYIEVLNVAGQRVAMQDVNPMDSGAIVNVNSLENGLYMFRVVLENGMSKTLQIMVNH